MANIFKAAAQTTNEIAKTLTAVTTQVAASYTTAWDAAKENVEYIQDTSNGSWAYATSNDRAQAANKAALDKVLSPWKDEDKTVVV